VRDFFSARRSEERQNEAMEKVREQQRIQDYNNREVAML
jgi:hypothetical protein